MEFLEHVDLEHAKLGIGYDEKIAAAARRVEETELPQPVVEDLKLPLTTVVAAMPSA